MWKWEISEPRGVVVMIHGAGEHHGRYYWLAEKWNEHGFDVVMGDLPGQGKTRGRRGHIQSFQQYLDSVDEWLNEARTKQVPILLFGHSMGGLVAIRSVMERDNSQIHGLILSSPCLELSHPLPKAKKAASKVLQHVAPTFSVNSGIRSDRATRNQDVVEAYLNDPLKVSKVSARWYQELEKTMRLTRRYPEKFPNIPLLLLQSGEDFLVDKTASQEWFNHLILTHKSYKEWEGLYHELFNEPERDEVFRHTIGFVNQLFP